MQHCAVHWLFILAFAMMGLGNKCGVLNAFIIVKLFFVWLSKNAIYNKRDICQWHFQILKKYKRDETKWIRNCCHLILIIKFRHMSFKVLKIWLLKPISFLKIILIFLKLIFLLSFWVINVLWQLGFLKHCIIWNNAFFYGNFCTSKKKLHNWH